MTIPIILVILCFAVGVYVALTLKYTKLIARRISMIFPLVVCVGYAVFYALIARGGGRELASFSRWLLLGTLTTFTIQAWAIRQSENGNHE